MKKRMDFDVIVVGAGHAGCEAALASARLGKKTLVLATQEESVALMPCNPSIGGTGKGQLVKEIDALGGEMGVLIDKTFIQNRMLNRSKGPAVFSPRAQADKEAYHAEMLKTLQAQENLTLAYGEAADLILSDEGEEKRALGIVLSNGEKIAAHAVVLATGVYLNGLVHISDRAWTSGPSGLAAATHLAGNMQKQGFSFRRFKTGTPARILASSVDFSKMKEQRGDEIIEPFSFLNEGKYIGENQRSCWLAYTNPKGHKIVADNIAKTAPYGGHTTGVGPRYCLSIEDKVSRFPERERHQLFLEPEGLNTDELYVQGMSTSLPEDLQTLFYRSIEGLENAQISKFGYSIEYDCIDPKTLAPSLESRAAKGLFFAGQINGTSGYEEAAAQGLIAGINAARFLDGKPPYTPSRADAYIGVLIDDLVTKGTEEPYRIMTSRAEFRLVLRQDNADLRLTKTGYELGLARKERFERCEAKRAAVDALIKIAPKKSQNISDAELIERFNLPEELVPAVRKQAEIQLKYAGYIDKQEKQIEKFRALEDKRIPENIDYESLSGLRMEARQKLAAVRPLSLGQAARISGVSPADLSVLMVYLKN